MTLADFRPMLAASMPTGSNRDLEKMDWSVGFYASPKVDGIRAIKHPHLGLISRTLKPIRNKHIQNALSHLEWNHMDGELIVGSLSAPLVSYNDNQSAIMSASGEPNFTYCVFDDISAMNESFSIRNRQAGERLERIKWTTQLLSGGEGFNVIHLEQRHVKTIDELLLFEEKCLNDGFEGVIFRDPRMPYKNNRSTFRQQGMVKLKRFEDAEARIIGYEELMHNDNAAYIDNLGYQKRTAHQENQRPGNTLGRLLVIGINGQFEGVEFAIGSGFDQAMRETIWKYQEYNLGRIVKYKYQPHGVKDKPRSPIFLGFRHKSDL